MEMGKNFIVDTHAHTNMSRHAHSTLEQYLQQAKKMGIPAFSITEHGPATGDGATSEKISKFLDLPPVLDGIRVFKGSELNIMNYDGELDISDDIISKMDIVLAGVHHTHKPARYADAAINAICSGKIDILTHPDNPHFPMMDNIDRITSAAASHGVAIEINEHSFDFYRGFGINVERVLVSALKNGAYISLGSDSHHHSALANYYHVFPLLDRYKVPKTRVVNSSLAYFESFLNKRRENR